MSGLPILVVAAVLLAAVPLRSVLAQDDALRPDWLIPGGDHVQPLDPRTDGDAMQAQVERQMKEMFGVGIEQMRDLSGPELMMRMLMGGGRTATPDLGEDDQGAAEPALYEGPAGPPPDPVDLLPTAPPAGGFPDLAAPLQVKDASIVTIQVARPAGRELLLVIADPTAQRILLNEPVRLPLERVIDLALISLETYDVVIELLDPESHRMVHRFRPVAGRSPDR